MQLFPLILIPSCALLNHLGGQSKIIPKPRFTARMLGQGIAFGIVAKLSGVPPLLSIKLAIIGVVSLAIWAATKWGPGFMAFKSSTDDNRDYTTSHWSVNYWLTRSTDRIMGIHQATALTPTGIHRWGMIYMIFHGALLYPLYAILGFLLTPWAFLLGLLGLLQGIIYRLSTTVPRAEYVMGAVPIGAGLALLLIIYLS